MRNAPAATFLRGSLKKLPFFTLLFCTCIVLIFQARTSPLAMIVLNTEPLSAGKLPYDWKITVNHGKPEVSACQDEGIPCIHLRSVKASFALERNIDVNPAEMPYLAWRWKVKQLPSRGDFRYASTDDQAAQVLVAFSDHHVLAYIWDSNAPKGLFASDTTIPLVHVYAAVCQSGTADLNKWIGESRNVAADYQRAYGKPAPAVKGVRLQINSQHTGSIAESYFSEVAFRSTPQ